MWHRNIRKSRWIWYTWRYMVSPVPTPSTKNMFTFELEGIMESAIWPSWGNMQGECILHLRFSKKLYMRLLRSGFQDVPPNHYFATCKIQTFAQNTEGKMYLTFEIIRIFVYAFVQVWIPRSNAKPYFLVATNIIKPFHKNMKEKMYLTFQILRKMHTRSLRSGSHEVPPFL